MPQSLQRRIVYAVDIPGLKYRQQNVHFIYIFPLLLILFVVISQISSFGSALQQARCFGLPMHFKTAYNSILLTFFFSLSGSGKGLAH